MSGEINDFEVDRMIRETGQEIADESAAAALDLRISTAAAWVTAVFHPRAEEQWCDEERIEAIDDLLDALIEWSDQEDE